jgi:hypothetical protein
MNRLIVHMREDFIQAELNTVRVDSREWQPSRGDRPSSVQAANYRDITCLLDVTCKTVANMIKAKTYEEVRRTFNIQNWLHARGRGTEICNENVWVEDRFSRFAYFSQYTMYRFSP